MSRKPSTFKQRDVTRAVKAIQAAGITAARAEIEPTGKIVIVFGEQQESEPMPALDTWRANRGARRN